MHVKKGRPRLVSGPDPIGQNWNEITRLDNPHAIVTGVLCFDLEKLVAMLEFLLQVVQWTALDIGDRSKGFVALGP